MSIARCPPRQSKDIGWDSDNLRGYVYVDANATLVVMAIKGTTLDFFGGSDTGAKDRLIVRLRVRLSQRITCHSVGPLQVGPRHSLALALSLRVGRS